MASRLIALLAIVFAFGACSGCTTSTALKGLATAHEIAVSAHGVTRQVCRPALERCIIARKNPCPALESCQSTRRPVLRSLDSLERAVLVGVRAADLKDNATLAKATATALLAAEQVCAGLEAWSITLGPCGALHPTRGAK